MAAITPTLVGVWQAGEYEFKTFRVAVTNANAADEWIDTGLQWIVGIVGFAPIGTAVVANAPAFKKNCQGTGGTEDTASTGGDLAIESDATTTYSVTVFGT